MSNESENKPARRVEDKRADGALDWTDAPRFTALGIAETWCVTVEAEGRRVVSISEQHCAGLADDDLAQFKDTIRSCAQHLLAFAGSAPIVSPAGAAAEKPTGDLPPLPWGDDFEAWLEPRRQKDVAAAMHDYARAAIALHIASQPTGDLTDEQAWKIATDLFGTVRYVSREDEYVKIENAADAGQFARAAIAAHLERQVQATSAPELEPSRRLAEA